MEHQGKLSPYSDKVDYNELLANWTTFADSQKEELEAPEHHESSQPRYTMGGAILPSVKPSSKQWEYIPAHPNLGGSQWDRSGLSTTLPPHDLKIPYTAYPQEPPVPSTTRTTADGSTTGHNTDTTHGDSFTNDRELGWHVPWERTNPAATFSGPPEILFKHKPNVPTEYVFCHNRRFRLDLRKCMDSINQRYSHLYPYLVLFIKRQTHLPLILIGSKERLAFPFISGQVKMVFFEDLLWRSQKWTNISSGRYEPYQ